MSKDTNIYYCVGCGKIHPMGNFYRSMLADHANGRLFYCKDFMKGKCYDDKGNIDRDEFRKLLRQLNIAFLPDLLDSSIDSGKDIIGAYFSTFNGLNQYKGMTWDDGVAMEEAPQEDEVEDEEQNALDLDEFVITPRIRNRWGGSYDKKAIRDLEIFYNDMHNSHSITSPEHERALIMMCKLQHKMDIYLDEENMSEFAKLHKEYQSVLASSGFRPIDRKGSTESMGMKSFSQISELVERAGFVKPNKSKESEDIVDRTIQYLLNYSLKLLSKPVLSEPPKDTPKERDKK